jgi:hypothetical protein
VVQSRGGEGGADILKHVRKLTAPLSAVFLILVAGFAFTHLQATTEYPPPILDPEFNLWVSNPELGGMKPMVWELEYQKSAGDQILLQNNMTAGKTALEIRIFQDGADDNLTYVRLGQTIDGARARALFDEEISIWVLLQTSCQCKKLASGQTVAFGIETNDGTHTLDYLFTGNTAETNISPTHRTISLQTQTGQWINQTIDLTEQYESANWKPPDRILLSIVFGVPGFASGWHSEYVHGFSILKRTTHNLTQQNEMTTDLPSKSPNILREIDQYTTPRQEAYFHVTRSPYTSDASLSQWFNL